MSTRKVVFAIAGTATGALLLIGVKGSEASSVGSLVGSATRQADLGSVKAGDVPAGTYSESGPVVTTPFGPVQVKVVVGDGKITDAVPLQLPTEHGLSVELATYAKPILRSEVLKAQSTSIDVVSGATYTSDAYAQSLQAALDQRASGS